MTTKNERQC